MERKDVLTMWFFWQFYEVPKFLLEVWSNYFIFMANFFSIPQLLKTFFAPWHRYQWSYPKGFDIQEFLSTLISNIFSRIMGVFMRIILILIGIILDLFVIIVGIIIILSWVLLPFVVAGLILFIFIF